MPPSGFIRDGRLNTGATKFLWIGFAILATYVSIYPANFQMPASASSAFAELFGTCCGRPGRGDMLGNFLLFVPFGFLGMLAARPAPSSTARILYICVIATVFAFLLQVAQIYLPSRDENLQDVVWNLLGTLAGIPIALSILRLDLRASSGAQQFIIAPWLLISAWLAYRLIPFVPSIDFQAIKDSLKPLLLTPDFSLVAVAHDAVAWSIVACFLRSALRPARLDVFLPGLILGTLALEVLIVANSVSASNVVGAGLAIALWFGLLRESNRREATLVFLLAVVLILSGIAPVSPRAYPADFNWLPFQGFLGGSMYINSQSACEKFFLYGSFVYLLWRAGVGKVMGTVIAAVFVSAIEVAQKFFDGHTPEITDPFIVVIAALVLAAFERESHVSHADGAFRDPYAPRARPAPPSRSVTARRSSQSQSKPQNNSGGTTIRDRLRDGGRRS